MPTIKKTAKSAIAPKDELPDELPTTPDELATEPEGIKVEHDEKLGTAKFSLVNGNIITLKEPKAKDFVYLASRMETAPNWQRSGTMACYILSHFMIVEVAVPPKGEQAPIPDFDEFMDMLEDEDLARVGAAFACFPNVLKRVGKIFPSAAASLDGAGAKLSRS